MIDIYNQRSKLGDVFPEDHTHHCSLEQAMVQLVKYELGYGGRPVVNQCTREQLVVRTTVLACVDTVRFVGPVEEMVWLIEVALGAESAYSLLLQGEELNLMAGYVTNLSHGNPFRVEMVTPLLFGGATVRASLLSMIQGILVERGQDSEVVFQQLQAGTRGMDIEKISTLLVGVIEVGDLGLADHLKLVA